MTRRFGLFGMQVVSSSAAGWRVGGQAGWTAGGWVGFSSGLAPCGWEWGEGEGRQEEGERDPIPPPRPFNPPALGETRAFTAPHRRSSLSLYTHSLLPTAISFVCMRFSHSLILSLAPGALRRVFQGCVARPAARFDRPSLS